MKGCYYNYIFTLPNKKFKEGQKLTMKELCTAVKKDLEEHYYIDDININNQILYNLQKRPQYCSKILRNRVSIVKWISA